MIQKMKLTSEQSLQLVRLRMLIARAGQKDSLRWWEDNSLTSHGSYTLERIFPTRPTLAGRSLAIITATKRHDVALEGVENAIHLYRIDRDNADQLVTRYISYDNDVLSMDAIPDIDTLRKFLLKEAGEQPRYKVVGVLSQHGGLRIELPRPTDVALEKAYALAWAYLESKVGSPIFPYMVESEHE